MQPEKIAIYGKGGVGKSMVATSLSASFGMAGRKVLHVGCDPKSDSSVRLLNEGQRIRTMLDALAATNGPTPEGEFVVKGRHGIDCCEAGGPEPGVGCGGRGVARTLELLSETKMLAAGRYDVVLFDVLGDVVCGGFAAPLRRDYAQKILVVVSEEPMSLFAANNICKAVNLYRYNGARMAGLVVNLRTNEAPRGPLERFAARISTTILGWIPRDPAIQEAEIDGRTIVESCPLSESARVICDVGARLLAMEAEPLPPTTPMDTEDFYRFLRAR